MLKIDPATRSCFFSGIKNWNEIPDNTRGQDSRDHIKKDLESTFGTCKAQTRSFGRAAILFCLPSFSQLL